MMEQTEICEISMLILFGCSWPFNIRKSWVSNTAKGKSLAFEVIVLTGYVFGVIGKVALYLNTGFLSYSVWFYLADIVMVLIDFALAIRNKALDQRRSI